MGESKARSSHDGQSVDGRARVSRRVLRSPREPFRVIHLLRLASRLSLQASLIGTVLAWPLALPASWLPSTDMGLGALGRDLAGELAILGSGDVDPLGLKAGVFIVLTVMATLAHLMVRFLDRRDGAPAVGEAPKVAPRRSTVARLPFLAFSALAIITYPILSTVWPTALLRVEWAPEIPAQLVFAGGSESTAAWSVLAAAVAWFFVAEDHLRRRSAGMRLLGLLVVLGVGASLLVLGDDTIGGYRGVRDGLFITTPGIDGRGGPLGSGAQFTACLIIPLLLAWSQLVVAAHRGTRADVVRWTAALAIMALAAAFASDGTTLLACGLGLAVLTTMLGRRAGMPLPRALAVGAPLVLLFVFLMQGLASRPAALDPAPINHVTEEAPSSWLSNVRLSAPVILWPVLRQNLLIGSGLTTFPLVYAECESRHSLLYADSPVRSIHGLLDRPSNELLRLLVENGLLGLVLVIAGVGSIGAMGWRAMRRTIQQGDIALQIAMATSMGTLMLLAIIDSPFRQGPAGLMMLAVLALWQAGGRLWQVEVRPFEAREPNESQLVAVPSNTTKRLIGFDGQWMRLSLAILALAAGWAPVVVPAALASQRLSTQYLVQSGERLITSGGSPVPAPQLHAAMGMLRLARLLDPMAPGLATATGWAFREQADQYLAAAENLGGAEREAARRRAQQAARSGLDFLIEPLRDQPQTTPERARVTALLEDIMARTAPEPEAAEHGLLAYQNLRLAVRLDGGHAPSIILLHEWLMADNAVANRPELDRLRRTLYRFHRKDFDSSLVGRVERLRRLLEFTQAADEMRGLLTVNTSDPELIADHAVTSFESGTPEGLFIAKDLANQMSIANTATAGVLRAQAAVRDGNLDRALEELASLPPAPDRAEANYRLALQRLIEWSQVDGNHRNDPAAARSLERALMAGNESSPDILLDGARIALIVFQDPSLALMLVDDAMMPTDRAARRRGLIIRAHALMALHPGIDQNANARRLEAARADLTSALAAFEQAHDLATSAFDRAILQRRIEQLRRLLSDAAQ